MDHKLLHPDEMWEPGMSRHFPGISDQTKKFGKWTSVERLIEIHQPAYYWPQNGSNNCLSRRCLVRFDTKVGNSYWNVLLFLHWEKFCRQLLTGRNLSSLGSKHLAWNMEENCLASELLHIKTLLLVLSNAFFKSPKSIHTVILEYFNIKE